MLSGACFCRAIRFEVEDAFAYAFNCHCSGCRRTTGAAFKPLAGIRREAFRVTAGSDDLLIYGSPEHHDAHCGICGSLVYSLVREAAWIHLPMGVLEDDPAIRPQCHIWVSSKAPWHEITDDLPQFQEFPE
jgi:hypothetical protein